MAQQAAVAIQNAQLFAETRRRVDESATLFRISTIAASALPPDELLRRLMSEVGTLVKADLGLAWLHNPDTDTLEPLLAASFGDLPENVRDFRIAGTDPEFERSVFWRRTVFRTDDALQEKQLAAYYRAVCRAVPDPLADGRAAHRARSRHRRDLMSPGASSRRLRTPINSA